MGVFGLGRANNAVVTDPQILARVYVPKAEDSNPHLLAAIGHEWAYAGGFSQTATRDPARSNAGAMGLDPRKIHGALDRNKQRREFTIGSAKNGMLEIGSPAFEARFPLGTMVTKGSIGEELLRDLPVRLLLRDGDKLVETEGVQRGSKQGPGMMDMLLLESNGKVREIPFDKVEVAFVSDPLVYFANEAKTRGMAEAPFAHTSDVDALVGRTVSVVARERSETGPGQVDRKAFRRFEGVLEAGPKPSQVSIRGIEGAFDKSELTQGRVFV